MKMKHKHSHTHTKGQIERQSEWERGSEWHRNRKKRKEKKIAAPPFIKDKLMGFLLLAKQMGV